MTMFAFCGHTKCKTTINPISCDQNQKLRPLVNINRIIPSIKVCLKNWLNSNFIYINIHKTDLHQWRIDSSDFWVFWD